MSKHKFVYSSTPQTWQAIGGWDPPFGDYYSKPSQPAYIALRDPEPESPASVAHRAWANLWYDNSRGLEYFWLGKDGAGK